MRLYPCRQGNHGPGGPRRRAGDGRSRPRDRRRRSAPSGARIPCPHAPRNRGQHRRRRRQVPAGGESHPSWRGAGACDSRPREPRGGQVVAGGRDRRVAAADARGRAELGPTIWSPKTVIASDPRLKSGGSNPGVVGRPAASKLLRRHRVSIDGRLSTPYGTARVQSRSRPLQPADGYFSSIRNSSASTTVVPIIVRTETRKGNRTWSLAIGASQTSRSLLSAMNLVAGRSRLWPDIGT